MAMADDRARVVSMHPTPTLVAAGTLTVAALGWFATNMVTDVGAYLIGWIFPAACTTVAAVATRQAARAPGIVPAARQFWNHMSVAMAVFACASVLHVRDAVSGPLGPTQRVGPLTLTAYMVGILAVLWALLRVPGATSVSRAERRRFWLDVAIVMITTGLISWYVSFSRLDEWTSQSGNIGVLILLLLGSMTVLTFVKVGLAGVGGVDSQALHILALAVAVSAAGGAVSPFMMDRPHLSNAMLSLPIGTFVLICGADRQRRAAGVVNPRPPRRRRPFSVVPYAAVAATDALLIAVAYGGGGEAVAVAVGAVALTGVVAFRQIAAFTENSRLLSRVDASVLELRDAQGQLAHQASHDDLTGLPNRRLFEARAQHALDDPEPACVILIDLDDFKRINDRLGHVLGDALLVIVGRRLLACVRPDDSVARFGGDEFALLLRGVSSADSARVLLRIGSALERPISVGGHNLLVQSSIGVADAVPDITPTELVRRADLAMYAAKERGKGRHARYEPGLDRQAVNDAMLGAELRQALDMDEFHLLYQPVVRLPDGRPAGAEALVRWQHPERGLVRPDLFIAAAERTGLIVPLGAWILNEACGQAAQWLRERKATQSWKVSVNISARQLREPGFAGDVAAALRTAGLPADRLMVEVTETAVFDNDPAVQALTEISALGVSVALDDFGTGHSSLGLLRTTPVDVLKVDKSFVDGITAGSEEAVIATAMIHLANGLHLGAVAEGVETLAQAERLHELGYRLAQGYYFARPLPPDEVGALLALEAGQAVPAGIGP